MTLINAYGRCLETRPYKLGSQRSCIIGHAFGKRKEKMVNRLCHWSRLVPTCPKVQTDLSPFSWIRSVR